MIMAVLFILSVGCLAFYALHIYLAASHKSGNQLVQGQGEKQRLALERLSGIWTNRATSEEPSDEMEKKTPADRTESYVSFQDKELEAFHAEHMRDNAGFPLQARRVVEGILEILDREGDCPSVVKAHGEAESLLEENAYNLLASVTLSRHTLNATEEMLRLIDPGPMTPVAVIAALGHDLGKIPGYRKKLYSLGDHPIISVTILEKIPGFSEISNREDIVKAIRDHHRRPVDFFSLKLKEADQEARKKEIAHSISLRNEEPGGQPKASDCEGQKRTVTVAKEVDYSGGNSEAGKKTRPRELSLPWYDGQAILGEIAPRINMVGEGRWEAFSTSNGYVYVQVAFLWSVAKKVARQNGDSSVLMGDADADLRRNILYTIVERLKTEQSAVARGLIRDGYFCAPFVLTMRDGTVHPKAWYVPFNLEAFGKLASDMESQKYGKVKEIVEVTPRWEKA
jgi:hypothetical protein